MSSYLFSCVKATYAVPGEYASLFSSHGDILSCSQGWEPGALNLAQACAMRFRTPLVHTETSCLLLDVERGEEQCWSRFTTSLSDHDKARLIERYWQSYRAQLHRRIRGDIDRHGLVFHVMIHSDPDQREHVVLSTPSKAELAKDLADKWIQSLRRDDLRCRHQAASHETNLSRELAQSHSPSQYAQIRLSVHQDFFLTGTPWQWATIKKHLLDTLAMSSHQVSAAANQRAGSVVTTQ